MIAIHARAIQHNHMSEILPLMKYFLESPLYKIVPSSLKLINGRKQ